MLQLLQTQWQPHAQLELVSMRPGISQAISKVRNLWLPLPAPVTTTFFVGADSSGRSGEMASEGFECHCLVSE